MDLKIAYKKLKSYAYYDKYTFLKCRISEFEFDREKFEHALFDLGNQLEKASFLESDYLRELIDKITVFPLPKTVKSSNSQIISNIDLEKKIYIDGLNFFIDAPVEIYLLSVLWLMEKGPDLQQGMSATSYAQRLNLDNETNEFKYPNALFVPYPPSYSSWLNDAIFKVESSVRSKIDVTVVSLDLRKCFYSISADEKVIKDVLDSTVLGKVLYKVFYNFSSKVRNYLRDQQSIIPDGIASFLPIGLPTSPFIANLYLSQLDKLILNLPDVVHYGRYVDDIILVTTRQPQNSHTDDFIYSLLVTQNVLKKDMPATESSYSLSFNSKIKIQSEKISVNFFSSLGSLSLLNSFKSQMRSNSSQFLRLDESNSTDSLWVLGPEESITTYRGIEKLKNDKFLLSSFLLQIIKRAGLTQGSPLVDTVAKDVESFFSGSVGLEYYQLWERIFTLFLISKKFKLVKSFYKKAQQSIKDVEISDKLINEGICTAKLLAIQSALLKYLDHSLMLASAHNPNEVQLAWKAINKDVDSYFLTTEMIRRSNMFRHETIMIPLSNLYSKILLKNNPSGTHLSLHDESEKILTELAGEVQDPFLLEYFPRWPRTEEKVFLESLLSLLNVSSCNDSQMIVVPSRPKDQISIALVNWKMPKTFSWQDKPTVKQKRVDDQYKEFCSIVNQVITEKRHIDVVVFPEASIPLAWIPLLINLSHRLKIGFIFGIEHFVVSRTVFNLMMEILPYDTDDKAATLEKRIHIDIRLKKHYAPEEKRQIEGYKYDIPKAAADSKPRLIHWRGLTFTSFICYELASISDRSHFLGKVNAVVALENNKDIDYFDSIATSCSRDLHCYFIQVNDSQYGDSKIVSPSKSYLRERAQIKGGKRPLILIETIEIARLAEFQKMNYELQKEIDDFKPTPPGWDLKKASD